MKEQRTGHWLRWWDEGEICFFCGCGEQRVERERVLRESESEPIANGTYSIDWLSICATWGIQPRRDYLMNSTRYL
jgi:hypothetical protein